MKYPLTPNLWLGNDTRVKWANALDELYAAAKNFSELRTGESVERLLTAADKYSELEKT